MPYNIAAGDSSGYNYCAVNIESLGWVALAARLPVLTRADKLPVPPNDSNLTAHYSSGRLDHQVYFKSIRVEQSQFEAVVLDRLLSAWVAEAAVTIPELAPLKPFVQSGEMPPHTWFWDGNDHVDPAKEANAQGQRLANLTTTLADEYGRRGLDWEAQLRQRAKEIELIKELGLPAAGKAEPTNAPPSTEVEQRGDDEEEEEEAGKSDRAAWFPGRMGRPCRICGPASAEFVRTLLTRQQAMRQSTCWLGSVRTCQTTPL